MALITTLGPASNLQQFLQLVSLVLLTVMIIEAVLLGASITRRARAEFPNVEIGGLRTGWCAFMRAHRMRRMRIPAPRVAPGSGP